MKKSKLIVRLKGGLGNQLFCYATARRLALYSNAELILDDVTGFKYDYQYKRKYALDPFNIAARKVTYWERLEPFGRLRRLLKKKIAARKPLTSKRYIVQQGVSFQEELLTLHLQSGYTYFDGFGQSERYFSDIRDVLREDLCLTVPADNEVLKYQARIMAVESVAIHMRWFDNNIISSANVPIKYYENAIKIMKQKLLQPHFFIFSDNLSLASKLLSPYFSHHEFTIVMHDKNADPIIDFFLMSKCKNFVIGNSTYAWWAAWLAEIKGASIIISPQLNVDANKNITAWGFDYLIPDRWKIL